MDPEEGDETHYLNPLVPSTDERALRELFPRVEPKLIEDLIFALTYIQHGGSGMTWTREDVLRTHFQEAIRAVDNLQEARRRDSAAIRKAARGKG